MKAARGAEVVGWAGAERVRLEKLLTSLLCALRHGSGRLAAAACRVLAARGDAPHNASSEVVARHRLALMQRNLIWQGAVVSGVVRSAVAKPSLAAGRWPALRKDCILEHHHEAQLNVQTASTPAQTHTDHPDSFE